MIFQGKIYFWKIIWWAANRDTFYSNYSKRENPLWFGAYAGIPVAPVGSSLLSSSLLRERSFCDLAPPPACVRACDPEVVQNNSSLMKWYKSAAFLLFIARRIWDFICVAWQIGDSYYYVCMSMNSPIKLITKSVLAIRFMVACNRFW